MSEGKKTAVVICPGRGTYNSTELGYLKRYHGAPNPGFEALIRNVDKARESRHQTRISELDAATKFKSSLHGTGDNASALIYTCAMADFKQIDLNQYDIVAVTGNSMGWYLALACAGVLTEMGGYDVVNTMGSIMHNEGLGGQVIYPRVDADWRLDPRLVLKTEDVVRRIRQQPDAEIYPSIALGGMQVYAANDAGITGLLNELPRQQDRYPFQLLHHSAFHSPLLKHIPDLAKAALGPELFAMAQAPLIDGSGRIWQPGAYSVDDIYRYTLEQQITETYNFSKAIEVSLKEFAPDKLIIPGPGASLGPPVAQQLISQRWHDLDSKQAFQDAQQQAPFVLSMGLDQQRALLI